MKSGIAGALIVIGMAMLIGSNYVGGVSEEQELSEATQEEFAQLTAAVHGRNPEESKAKVDRLQEIQRDIIGQAEAGKKKQRTVKFAGLGATILGICCQIWAWTDKKKA